MDDILKDNWSNTHDSISKQIKQRIAFKLGPKWVQNESIKP